MLRKMILSAALIAGCAGMVRAAAKDEVQSALAKLADSPNYSWKSTVEGGQGGGDTLGKTQKDGVTLLSITRQDNTYEVVIDGKKSAVKTDDGWKSAAELTAGGAGGGGQSPDRFLAMTVQNFKSPVAMAQDVVAKLDTVNKSDGIYSADLSEDAAKLALTFRRRGGNGAAPKISDAKGSIKIWLKDGTVSKMESHISGTVTYNGNDRDIDRTTTTEFSDVGSTEIKVPDEAKAKLTAPAATQP